MGRILVISALVHLVLLVVVPRVPALRREYDAGLDVYTVDLVDVAPPPAPAEEVTSPEPAKVETPKVEEPKQEAIPEQKKPAPKRVVTKPPPEKPEPTLEQRLAERLKEQDARRPASPAKEEARPTPGAQPSGRATVSASRFPYAWYLSVVQGKVSSNWTQPSARLITEDSLTVVVSFRIRRDGSVEGVTVRRSSGRATVDESATKAVRAAAPFPPLPDDYRESSLDVTIDFTVTR